MGKEAEKRMPDEYRWLLLDENRWIGQLNKLYAKIVSGPCPPENLDKANEVICQAIERLRPLTV